MKTTHKIKEESEPETESRRGFLKKIWLGLGFVALCEVTGVIYAFLKPRKPRVKQGLFGGVIIAGGVDDFEKKSVTAFQRGRFYLVRLADGGFLALSRKCTHLGCTVPWVESEKKFTCPCHASAFNIKGEVLRSPASRPLDIYSVYIENNIVKVDTGRLTKRSRFDKSQVTYPTS